jgi:aminoglycoside phosphotransferase family enzyme
MAAQWLAHFHNLAMHITPAEEHSRTEPSRLHWYLRHFFFQKHPDRNRIEEIREKVWDLEKRLLASHPGRLVQGHGDYHLKNIYLGLDRSDRIEYVCAIDFHSSYQLPRAFDVGSFIAQHLNMFFDLPEIAQKAPADIFLHEYLSRAENLEEDFLLQVELFKARTCLSILYYLYKVGKHESENFRQIIGAAEKSIMRARLISFH